MRTKKLVTSKPIIIDDNFYHDRIPELAYIHGRVNIKNWIKQLTAGIIVHSLGRHELITDWDNALVWCFEYYEQEEMRLREYVTYIKESEMYHSYFNHLPWRSGWSAHPRPYPPNIYRFEVCLNINPNEILIRHIFYDSYKWYIRFTTSERIQETIKTKLY